MTLTVGSLFAGIGGFDLGLERAGMRVKWQVEIDDYCNRVLAKHWPDVPRYRDVHEVGRENLEPVDLICGGFPCQPFSVAGKREGEADDRNLWPEMLRVIREVGPRWVIGENVPGLIPLYLDQVLADLEDTGYTCWPFVIPAVAFDAPHRRDRLWIVGYAEGQHRRNERQDFTNGSRRDGGGESRASGQNAGPVADASGTRPQERNGSRPRKAQSTLVEQGGWPAESDVGRVADGVPNRVDRLRALGNAVVPQVVEHIGRMILEYEHDLPAP